MGWFDEQIKQRNKLDDEAFEEAFAQMAGAVTRQQIFPAGADGSAAAKHAVKSVCDYFGVRIPSNPEGTADVYEILSRTLEPVGVMHRQVTLDSGWHRDAAGVMLARRRDDGSPVAIIPMWNGVCYTNEKGRMAKVTAFTEKLFEDTATVYYRPLPQRSASSLDLLKFISKSVTKEDMGCIALAAAAVSLIGLFVPFGVRQMFSSVIDSGEVRLLIATAIFLMCSAAGGVMMRSVQTLLSAGISDKAERDVNAAVMMRVLSLPPSFFKQFSTGELTERMGYAATLCRALTGTVLSGTLLSTLSLVYVFQIGEYTPGLVLPAVAVTLLITGVNIAAGLINTTVLSIHMEHCAHESGVALAMIQGVQKIRLAGAQKRAFARWADAFADAARYEYGTPTFLTVSKVICTGISMAGTAVIYYKSVTDGISVSDYFGFTSSFGLLSGAFSGLAAVSFSMAQIRASLKMLAPILETAPETNPRKRRVEQLKGNIELSNISFGYGDSPLVIKDLSLKIRAGEYVAIVGSTGCGKSTLIRLMLGFEEPKRGAVYFDGRDITKLDLHSLRQHIGVVLQHGRLFQGDIYSNIAICAPGLSADDAWKAAELAGIAEDIRSMPMGMHTFLSEGGAGISGGQRQRLMIARALAGKPSVLILDEATSALDNLTQRHVADTLAALDCTRIVIAHRLSSIKQCDRIIYLENGTIAEDGTFEELMEKHGAFAALVERQTMTTSP